MDNTITFEDIMKYHPDNPTVFNEIQKGIQHLIPFVGAGLSVPFGYPNWAKYLSQLNSKVLEKNVRESIQSLLKGTEAQRYENAAQLLAQYRGENNFRADIMTEFSKERLNNCNFLNTAVYVLPLLFQGLVLTTNYDKVLETVYHMHGYPFDAVAHPGHHELLNTSLSGFSKNILFKLHGDISEGTSLIFTKSSYDQAYTPDGPLIKSLRKCFAQVRLLFLGCSLEEDRTMEVLQSILEPGIIHYTFLSCKKDDRAEQIRRLDKLGIRAVLFPDGQYDSVKILLLKLAENMGQSNLEILSDSPALFPIESVINRFLYAYEKLYSSMSSFYLLHINKKIFPGLKSQDIYIKPEGEEDSTPMKKYLLKMWEKGSMAPLLFVGEGGSGKTVTLLQACRDFLDEGICASFVPINELSSGGIKEYLHCYLWERDSEQEGNFYSFLKSNEEKSRPIWFLCLDGFNEADECVREGVCDFVREWISCPNVQIILSSRYEKLLNYGFSQFNHITIQPLETSQVKTYLMKCGLKMPHDRNGLAELLSLPLMLTLYTQTEYCQMKFQDSDFLSYINPMESAEEHIWTTGLIIWNFLQCQIGKLLPSNTKKTEKLEYIVALEYVGPYICWQMEREGIFHVQEDTFFDWVESAAADLQQSWDLGKPLRIKRLESIFPELETCDIIKPQRMIYILTYRLHIFNRFEKRYGLMHHHFRDCLTAIHLINEAELKGIRAHSWTDYIISHNVQKFLQDLMMPESFKNLWDSFRDRVIARDDYGLYNAVEFMKNQQKTFSQVDFSRMDLRLIHLDGFTFSQQGQVASFRGAQIGTDTFNVHSHSEYIKYLSFSQDGRYLFSGSSDEAVIWNAKNWLPIRTIPADSGIHPVAVAFAHGDEQLFVADDTHAVSLWWIEGEQQLAVMHGHTGAICHVQVSADASAGISSSEDGTAIIWDLMSYEQQCVLKGHSKKVCCAYFSVDGMFILTGSSDQSLKIWDRRGVCKKTLVGHKAEITAAAWIPNEASCLSGDALGEVRLWNTENGECCLLESCDSSVVSLSVSADGKHCLVGKKSGRLYIWNLERKQCEKEVSEEQNQAFSGSLMAACFSANERISINIFSDCPVFQFDLTENRHVTEQKIWSHPKYACFSQERTCIACINEDSVVEIYNVEKEEQTYMLFEKNSEYGVFSKDGRYLAVQSESESTLRLFDLQALIVENRLQFLRTVPYKQGYYFQSFSRDGKKCAILPKDRTVENWSVFPFQKTDSIYAPISRDVAAALYQGFKCCQMLNGIRKCIVGTETGDVQLWDFASHSCEFSLRLDTETYSSGVSCVACSTNNQICLASIRNIIYQVNLDGGIIEHTYSHMGEVTSIAWTVNDHYFVSGCRDETLYCWYPETGECLWNIGKRVNRFYRCDCFADGRRILLGASDGVLRTFNLQNCRTENMIQDIECASKFSLMPDGIRCLTWNENSISVWNLQTKQIERFFSGSGGTDIEPGIYFNANQVVLAPDGKKCFIMEQRGSIKCLDLITGDLKLVTNHMSMVFNSYQSLFPTDLAVSSDCRYIVPGCNGHRSFICDMKLGRGMELYTNGCTVMVAAFSPDGQYLAGGSGHGDVFLWKLPGLEYGTFTHDLVGHNHEVTSVSFTNDSKKVISASSDGTIRVWELTNFECENILQVGEKVAYVQILQDDVHCVCITQTGMYFSIWNLLSGECCKKIHCLSEINIVDCDFSGAEFDNTSIKDMVYWSGGRIS